MINIVSRFVGYKTMPGEKYNIVLLSLTYS